MQLFPLSAWAFESSSSCIIRSAGSDAFRDDETCAWTRLTNPNNFIHCLVCSSSGCRSPLVDDFDDDARLAGRLQSGGQTTNGNTVWYSNDTDVDASFFFFCDADLMVDGSCASLILGGSAALWADAVSLFWNTALSTACLLQITSRQCCLVLTNKSNSWSCFCFNFARSAW